MQIGRNDPRPCGSRKKYKHCCQGEDNIIPFPTEMVESTPIVALIQGYLEYIVRKGGSIEISEELLSRAELDLLFTIIEKKLKIDLEIVDQRGNPILIHFIQILPVLCSLLGYTMDRERRELITDKGKRVLKGKYLKNCYFAALKEYERDFNCSQSILTIPSSTSPIYSDSWRLRPTISARPQPIPTESPPIP